MNWENYLVDGVGNITLFGYLLLIGVVVFSFLFPFIIIRNLFRLKSKKGKKVSNNG